MVGKFYPLHRGHMLVIETALAACDEVVVISYTNPESDGCGPFGKVDPALAALAQRGVRWTLLEGSLNARLVQALGAIWR